MTNQRDLQQYVAGLTTMAAQYSNFAREKAASIGISGEQYIPMAPVANGAGSYDPDPNQPYSMMAANRAAIQKASMLDGQALGTNLSPYANVVNQMHPAIAYATKQASALEYGDEGASYDEGGEELDEIGEIAVAIDQMDDAAYVDFVNQNGDFDDCDVVPSRADYINFLQETHEKAASMSDTHLIDMYNSGVLEQHAHDLVPYLIQ